MEGLGIDWKILIGQIINFVILLWLLKKFAYKPFLSILEKRKTQIEEGIKKSEEAEKSLEKIRNLSQEIKEKGEKEARDLIIAAELKAKTRAEEIMVKAQTEKEKVIEATKIMIERETKEGAKKREKEAVETAFLLAEKFLDEKLDEERDKKIIEEAIANLKQ